MKWIKCDIDCMARSISKLTEQKLMKKSKLMKSKNLKFLQYVSIHVTVSDWRPEGLRLKDIQNGVGYWDLTHFDGSTPSSLFRAYVFIWRHEQPAPLEPLGFGIPRSGWLRNLSPRKKPLDQQEWRGYKAEIVFFLTNMASMTINSTQARSIAVLVTPQLLKTRQTHQTSDCIWTGIWPTVSPELMKRSQATVIYKISHV